MGRYLKSSQRFIESKEAISQDWHKQAKRGEGQNGKLITCQVIE